MVKNNVYVGQRYVPKIMGDWLNTNTYEGLSIVTHQGNSYTSKKRVPTGIDISNEEYWVVTGNYNAQIEHYREEVNQQKEHLESFEVETNRQLAHIEINANDYGVLPENTLNENTLAFSEMLQTTKTKRVFFGKDGVYQLKLTISDLSDVTIDGSNKKFSIPDGTFIEYSGVVKNVDITGFDFLGNGLSTSFISSSSGVQMDGFRVHHNKIKNCKIGVSLNADLSGYVMNSSIYENDFDTIVGTDPSQGYGTHISNHDLLLNTNNRVYANRYNKVERHAIYMARGAGYTIEDNIITNHRQGIVEPIDRSAIVVSRSKFNRVVHNNITNCYASGIGLSPATEANDTTPLTDTVVEQNLIENFTGVGIICYPYGVGTAPLKNVSIKFNIIRNPDPSFYTSQTRGITVNGGDLITVEKNEIDFDNLPVGTSGVSCLALAVSTSEFTSDDWHFIKNTLKITNGRHVRFQNSFSESLITTFFENNKGSLFVSSVNVTNPNIYFYGYAPEGIYFTPTENLNTFNLL